MIAQIKLTEVLITLGIIGVVAALTLPSIIEHHQKKATSVKLKKAYSILTNALRMAEADYGGGAFPLRDKIFANFNTSGDNLKVFETYFVPYLQGAKNYSGKQHNYKTSSNGIAHYVANLSSSKAWCINNGMCFEFMNSGRNYCYILVDLNGPQKGLIKLVEMCFIFRYILDLTVRLLMDMYIESFQIHR